MKNKLCPVCHNNKNYHSSDCPKVYKNRGNKSRNRFRTERRNTQDDYMFFFRER